MLQLAGTCVGEAGRQENASFTSTPRNKCKCPGLVTALSCTGDLGHVLIPLGKKRWDVETFWCAKLVIPTPTLYKRNRSNPTSEVRRG